MDDFAAAMPRRARSAYGSAEARTAR